MSPFRVFRFPRARFSRVNQPLSFENVHGSLNQAFLFLLNHAAASSKLLSCKPDLNRQFSSRLPTAHPSNVRLPLSCVHDASLGSPSANKRDSITLLTYRRCLKWPSSLHKVENSKEKEKGSFFPTSPTGIYHLNGTMWTLRFP